MSRTTKWSWTRRLITASPNVLLFTSLSLSQETTRHKLYQASIDGFFSPSLLQYQRKKECLICCTPNSPAATWKAFQWQPPYPRINQQQRRRCNIPTNGRVMEPFRYHQHNACFKLQVWKHSIFSYIWHAHRTRSAHAVEVGIVVICMLRRIGHPRSPHTCHLPFDGAHQHLHTHPDSVNHIRF